MPSTENRERTAARSSIGERIREAREGLQWTQQRLAEALGVASSQIISTIESGQREVKAWELFRIAGLLHTPAEWFLGATELHRPQVQWRAKPQGNDAPEIEARFLQRCERYALLEKWCETPPFKELKPITVPSTNPSFYVVGREAQNVREAMGLGVRPACTLEKTIEEDYGVKIFYESLGDKGAGFSVNGPFGPAILMNADNVPWRRNFSIAHELFHLLTPVGWESPMCEKLADVFASALLLPAEPLIDAIAARIQNGKISFERLVEIACEFEVSIDALLWRLVNLGRLGKPDVERALSPDSQLRRLDRISRPTSSQPTVGLPDRYIRLCYLAYRNGRIGRSKLAELLETNLVDLSEQLDEEEADNVNGAEADIAVAGC
jgi:Zn-dependent peptidase ImmA (M78 family)/transcriptional regulator with XRE-family HTH domain